MNDRELLELAAKAAGYARMEYRDDTPYVSGAMNGESFAAWNPLTDDGDALLLAVMLKCDLTISGSRVKCVTGGGPNAKHAGYWVEEITNDPQAATRRAIVRAAANAGDET